MATIFGTPGNDDLTGTPADDYIDGGPGADTMAGGAGNDIYVVDDAGDVVNEAAGEGEDRVYAQVSYALTVGSYVEILAAGDFTAGTLPIDLTGNEHVNNLWGNAAANVLLGLGGNDALFGFDGDDSLVGHTGHDLLVGGAGNDLLFGGEGLDGLTGGAGNDVLDGGTGGDQLRGQAGDDTYYVDEIFGDRVFEAVGEGTDRVITSVDYVLSADAEVEILASSDPNANLRLHLSGNDFANSLWGDQGPNELQAHGGDDFLFGYLGPDYLYGSWGNDYLDGGGGQDTMYGGPGDDVYVVDHALDTVYDEAGAGFDRINATVSYSLNGPGAATNFSIEVLSAGDTEGLAAIDLTGHSLDNNIWGNAAANVLSGEGGADSLFGFGGDDTLLGGAGDDFLDGGDRNDILDGGLAIDTLIGGAGSDTFRFTTALGGNVDQIYDYESGIDEFELDNAVFTGLAAGAFNPDAFRAGTAAVDADDRVIYDSATGQLLFDPDGTGGETAIWFAVVTPGTALTSVDFTVI